MKLEGCFETMLYVDGNIPLLEYHFRRLERSLNHLGWTRPEGLHEANLVESVRREVSTCLADIHTPDVEQRFRVRLSVSRSLSANYRAPNVVSIKTPTEAPTEAHNYENSASQQSIVSWTVDLQPIIRDKPEYKLGLTQWDETVFQTDIERRCKLSQRQPYTVAFEQAQAEGYDDTLIMVRGMVSETAIANLLWMRGGLLYTSGPESGALRGVAMEVLREVLDGAGIHIEEENIGLSELIGAESVWLINAVRGPVPVTEINGQGVSVSREWNERLRRKYWDRFSAEGSEVPRQRIRFVKSRAELIEIVQARTDSGEVQKNQQILHASDPRKSQNVIFLDSQLKGHPSSERSIVFTDFVRTITFTEGTASIRNHSGAVIAELKTDPWQALEQFRSRYPGYHSGYLGYDLKNYTENLKSTHSDPIGLPEMWMGYPAMVYLLESAGEMRSGNATVALSAGDAGEGPTSGTRIPSIFEGGYTRVTGESEQADATAPQISLEHITDRDVYIQKIQRAKEYIHDGDIYEVNLSHQIVAKFHGNPLQLYESMRQRGPVPYASFMHLDGISISCASPERFLRKSGDRIISDPIKGTRPRGRDEHEDREIREQLYASDKEKAENLMIVDLVRNDLSRVCHPGSVRVTSLFEIQSFGTVHQMVSRVEGEALSGIRPEQILSACFPMGSMTGAPKIRAMEVIDELENYRRGLYSGAIGFFAPDGDFNFNVVIRSAIIRGDKLWYAAGGAITSDSEPQQEWDETLVKARALGMILPS